MRIRHLSVLFAALVVGIGVSLAGRETHLPTLGGAGEWIVAAGTMTPDQSGAGAAAGSGAVAVAATTAPSGTVLASDDFCDRSKSIVSPVAQPDQWIMGNLNCEYQIKKIDTNSGGTGIALAGNAVADEAIAVDARFDGSMSSAAVFGVGCRYVAQGSSYVGYRFVFGPVSGQWNLFREEGGANSNLAQGDLGGAPIGSATYHLQLSCSGTTIAASINNKQVTSVQEGTYAAGQAFIYGRISQGTAGRPIAAGSVDARFTKLTSTQP